MIWWKRYLFIVLLPSVSSVSVLPASPNLGNWRKVHASYRLASVHWCYNLKTNRYKQLILYQHLSIWLNRYSSSENGCVLGKLNYKSIFTKRTHTSSFWCLRRFLLISRFIAIVILFFSTSSSHWAKQHSTGLEESNQERLFGLGPVPPNDSSRFYVDASSFKKKTAGK